MDGIREKIERMKIKAEQLLNEDKQAFIIDINNTYFFCDLLIIGENKIIFQPFKGNNSEEKMSKYWADILKIDEYREEKK